MLAIKLILIFVMVCLLSLLVMAYRKKVGTPNIETWNFWKYEIYISIDRYDSDFLSFRYTIGIVWVE